jgi:hypothetical protein
MGYLRDKEDLVFDWVRGRTRMVVGEGLFVVVRLTLRAALKCVVSLRETRTLSKLLIPPGKE